MKVFTCVNHATLYPTGGASVVVAEDKESAENLLAARLLEHGLMWDGDEDLVELDVSIPSATVLYDGNY